MITLTVIIVILSAFATIQWTMGDKVLRDFNVERTLPVRGVLALLVVVIHVAQNVPDAPVINIVRNCASVVVGTFFFLSGYGLMVSYLNKGRNYLNGFLCKRFGKLLPPFLLVALLYQAWQSFNGESTLLESLAAISYGGTMLPDSWFVLVILLYYLLFYLCARLLRNKVALVAVLWVISAIYVVAVWRIGWANYWYNSVFAINVGFTYALLEPKIKTWLTNSSTRLPVALWLVAAVVLFIIFTPISNAMLGFVTPLLLVLIVYAAGMVRWQWLKTLGVISLEIYLVQCVLRHKLYFLAHDTHWSVYLIATLVSSIAAAFLLHWFMQWVTKNP